MLEALLNRLRHFHQDNEEGYGRERRKHIKEQAEHACAFAREHGILATPDYSFSSMRSTEIVGSEHLVDFSDSEHRVVKVTVPKGFGLAPALISKANPLYELHEGEEKEKKSIEFVHATPLEYLTRWSACNQLFNDDIVLHKVILWGDERVSFVISQPQYHGDLPSHQEIEEYFETAGWQRIPNKRGHAIYFNYAYQVLAMDVEPRNCYISPSGELLPFDVILSTPDKEVEDFLGLY